LRRRCEEGEKMGSMYLLSTGFVPVDEKELEKGVYIQQYKITVEEAKNLLKQGFISAVGHESTAKFMSHILGMEIPVNRTAVWLKAGDRAVGFVLKTRLPEGKVLTEEELKQIPFFLVYSRVLSPDQVEVI
jgi:hypothetical protein